MALNWNHETHGIEVATAGSSQEFVDALRPSNLHWWERDSCPWVFRGHKHEEWLLLPSAWRPENAVIENSIREAARRFDAINPTQMLRWYEGGGYVGQEIVFGENDKELARQLTIRTTSELLPIWDFAEKCDRLGMSLPLIAPGPDPILEPNWLAWPNAPLRSDDLLHLIDLPALIALAQHHGIPTRFLDWTRNPMTAGFFAVEHLDHPEPDENLAVWGLHTRNAIRVSTQGIQSGPNHINPTIEIVRPYITDNPFMAAQSGLFTTIKHSGIYFMTSGGRRPHLQEFIAGADPRVTVLRKLVLSHNHSSDLKEIVRRENISRSTLMPSRDNIAKEVCTAWSQRIFRD
jgi:FRG domain